MGSLVTALASYLDAKAAGAEWIVRIEDVDTPRTVPGAADSILRSLDAHGLEWDGPVIFQSERSGAYHQALRRLGDRVYPCGCSRRDVMGKYPGTCREGLGGRPARSFRLRVPSQPISYTERLLGRITESLAETCGDFVLLRADGVSAYQLAVVVDDIAQGITDVVRGADLLESTGRQVYLYGLLGATVPRYLHVPVVCDAAGEKLSKQTRAPALEDGRAGESLEWAFDFLGNNLPKELCGGSPREMLEWGIQAWDIRKMA